MDDQVEMITALTTVLIQPLETGGQGQGPGPEPGQGPGPEPGPGPGPEPGPEPVEVPKVKEEDRRVEEEVECSVRL